MTARGRVLALALPVAAALLATLAIPMPTALVWNASASLPLGLYALVPVHGLVPGDIVALQPPGHVARFLVARGYIGAGVPMLKRLAAGPSQTVCREGALIRIDGVAAAIARTRDSRGRLLPVWQGCRVLGPAEVFLLNADAPDSLDGRYLGPLPRATILGRALPLWTGAPR